MPVKPPSGKPDEKEPEVVIAPSETSSGDGGKQEIIIDANTGKPAEPSHPQLSADEIEKRLKSQFFYELRQSEKRIQDALTKSLQNFQAQPATRVQRPSSDEIDEIDQIAEHDWKKAVNMLAEKKAEELLKKYEEEKKAKDQTEQAKKIVLDQEERSKQRVLQEFPDLVDENSQVFKEYMGVFNREVAEDPSFLENPRKHDIVAAQIRGKIQSVQQVNPEVERLRRVAAGAQGATRTVQSGNRITLTQEEIDICDKSGIPYSVYAKNRDLLAKGGFKEGLEIKS